MTTALVERQASGPHHCKCYASQPCLITSCVRVYPSLLPLPDSPVLYRCSFLVPPFCLLTVANENRPPRR
jgi:hypothetical protein